MATKSMFNLTGTQIKTSKILHVQWMFLIKEGNKYRQGVG